MVQVEYFKKYERHIQRIFSKSPLYKKKQCVSKMNDYNLQTINTFVSSVTTLNVRAQKIPLEMKIGVEPGAEPFPYSNSVQKISIFDKV